MKKMCRRLFGLLMAVCFFYTGGILADREMFRTRKGTEQNSLADSFRQGVSDATNMDLAREYLQTHFPKIREAADNTLQELDVLSCFQADEKGYQIRFYFLDLLGKLENFFFGE